MSSSEAKRWEHWLVHLLWAASTRTSMLGESALAESPLTLAGLGVLENVAARPGVTITEMARSSPQTQQALSQIVARVERLGLVERQLSRGTRGVALHLTEAGAQARAVAHETIETFEASLAEALGRERHERLVDLLEQAKSIIYELEPQRPTADRTVVS
jgi:DNA-binding MarR family transcriptional regulator